MSRKSQPIYRVIASQCSHWRGNPPVLPRISIELVGDDAHIVPKRKLIENSLKDSLLRNDNISFRLFDIPKLPRRKAGQLTNRKNRSIVNIKELPAGRLPKLVKKR